MKLIITQALNKIKLVMAFRKLYPDYPLPYCLKLSENLPYIQEKCWYKEEDIKKIFDDAAVYVYVKEAANYNGPPPWETQKYIDAMYWLESQPDDVREKINIIVSARTTIYG